jgi:hypothetical protein
VQRRIFGLGVWRKLHNGELRNFYSLPNIIRMITARRMRWAGHVAQMGVKRNAVGKPEGKTPIGRPRCRWVDNIKMDLAEDRDQWRVLVNTDELSGSLKCWEVLK